MTSPLTWLEEQIGEVFNEERDAVCGILENKIKEETGLDVYDLELGNWVSSTINCDNEGGDSDTQHFLDITSSKNDEGVITVTMSNCNLFDGSISVVLNEEKADNFNNMMVVGQTWDVFTRACREPVPDLNHDYNPYALPDAPIKKL